MLPPYTDRLDSARQSVFKHLSAFANRFTLAGGTAMMLQVGHRYSYDFDCFSQDPLSKILPSKIKKVFGSSLIKEVDEEWMYSVRTKDGVVVSFVHHPYPTLRKPVRTDFIPLFHLDDLAANKANVIGRRPAWRDYVDLFFFLKWKMYSMETLISLASKKFAGEFNAKLFLQQLVYFNDVRDAETIFLKESYTPKEVKAFLGRQVDAYLKTVLPI